MNKWLILILIISIVGNLIGLFVFQKFLGLKKYTENIKRGLGNNIEDLTDILDKTYPHKMIFLHHSVGKGILYEGGLRDSLLEMGILVKGATYGDEIGENTDICDWLPKFENNMDRIVSFKAHPDRYYSGDYSNEIVMFKSCFPNSDITGEGSEPGDPYSKEGTIRNYMAVFDRLGEEMMKHGDRLFIYMTPPPLVTEQTSPANAERAIKFNRWLTEEYLPRYKQSSGLDNFYIFDLFHILADEKGFLKQEYRTGKPGDSHPNLDANKIAAKKFMEFFKPLWEEKIRKT